MTLLVRSALIIDPSSPYHQQELDVLLKDGRIAQIGTNIGASDAEVLQVEGLCLSPGWMDSFAQFCDPGMEHREDLKTGANAAAAGGFTAVAIVPNTDPPLHSKSELEYIRYRSATLPIHIYPYGAISRGIKGQDIAELYDMRNAGAIALVVQLRHVRWAAMIVGPAIHPADVS